MTEMGAEKANLTLSSRAAKADRRLHMPTFSQEPFVGINWVQTVCTLRLSADDTSTDDFGHKCGAEKKKYNVHFILK